MATAQSIITGALRRLGVIASGEAPSAAEMQDGLTALNDVLEAWSIDSLTVFTQQEQTFSTVVGQIEYTLGPGAQWDGARPVQIDSAVAHFAQRDHPLEMVSLERWDAVSYKDLRAWPRVLYYRPDYPAAVVRLWPTPWEAVPVKLNSTLPLTRANMLTQQLVLPPGYERALRYAVALEVAPEFGIEPPAAVVANARSSKAALKRLNQADPPELEAQPRQVWGLDAFLSGGY